MFGNRRNEYTLITKHSQTLNHLTEQNDTDSPDSQLSGLNDKTVSDLYFASNERIPTQQSSPDTKALSAVTYNIYGFQISRIRQYLFHFISILFFGIPYFIFRWLSFGTQLKYRKCDLGESDVILVTNNRGHSSVEPVKVLQWNGSLAAGNYRDILKQINTHRSSVSRIRIFVFEHIPYVFNYRLDQFVRMQNLDEISTVNQLMGVNSDRNGLADDQRDALLQLYGSNIIEIAIKSYWELFRSEILNPFYLFQIFSITLWSLDDYYYYAGCVFILSAISIYASLHETRTQSKTLHNVVESLRADNISVVQPGHSSDGIQLKTCSPDYLVPGDIIAIPIDGGIMACDAVLLSGSCIVNESMLTGESLPVTKTPPMTSDQPFEWMAQKRHILYAGTTVLQTRYYGNEKVLARVVRTGFNTSKGELIKSILYPRPVEFRFYEDSIKLVSWLFVVAAIGMVYTVRIFMDRGADNGTIMLRALDVVTIVVPPALPLAMTAGTIYSQARLKMKNIFCISPQRINICGKLKLICFDKTGTLTDDGLTMDGCIECRLVDGFGAFVTTETVPPNTFDEKSFIVQNMATCHSLTTIHGTLNGDPLDIEMFRSINWECIEAGAEAQRYDTLAPTIVRPCDYKSPTASPTASPTTIDSEITEVPYSIGIIKQHQFSSEAQCMSVIVRALCDNHMKVFSKGAPEKILSLCHPKSIPNNYYHVLHRYTARGYRVIAMAHKKLSSKIKWIDVERMKRSEIETDLIFDGFLVLLNCLKPETTHIIQDLHAAKLRTVMITGDNIMTALSVAKDCQMIRPNEDIYVVKCEQNENHQPKLTVELSRENGTIEDEEDAMSPESVLVNMPTERFHFALDGPTWNAIQTHFPQFLIKIIARGTVFARFRPEQKSQIVVRFQQFDYIVAMCGDGANDCGALKAAHIGISLSQAEASVAAPFTSKDQNIACVKHLILEGRCALVTSFGLFKYMTMYSLIQFCTILLLYTHNSILGNFQFLYIDLVITASLAFTMGRQGPATKLVPKRPTSSLLSLSNMIPLCIQVLVCGSIQFIGIVYLNQQDWYNPSMTSSHSVTRNSTAVTPFEEETLCWENTVLFLISCYQYLILGVVYSKGLPYRQALYTNGLLLVFVVLIVGLNSLLALRPFTFLSDLFEIEPFSTDQISVNAFRYGILLFPLTHLILSYGIENLIVDRRWYKKCLHFILRKKFPKNKFKKIELDLKMNSSSDWMDFFGGSDTVCQPA